MNYIWYPDTFFLRVFLTDLVAYLTAYLLIRKRIKSAACILTAVGSALTETLLFWLMHHYFRYRIVLLLLVNPCCVWLLFRGREWKLWVRGYLTVSMLLLICGGIQNFWFGLFQQLRENWIWYAALSVLSGYLCVFGRKKKTENDMTYSVRIEYKGCAVELQGLLDTGNCLSDPYTGLPVNVVSASVIEENFSLSYEKVRYIPYHTVGQKEKLMKAFTADKMYLYQKGRKQEIQGPVIGLAQDQVFVKNQIQILLNHELM